MFVGFPASPHLHLLRLSEDALGKLNLPFIAFNLIYSISKQEMLSNVFCIAAHKNWQAFFCKNGLIGRRGGGIAAGTERACAVREGRLAFFKKM